MDQRARSSNIDNEPYSDVGRDRAVSWAATANYYFLTFFVGAFVFIVVLAFLYDGYDESPWVVAALASIVSIVSFVVFREVVIRRTRERERAARRLAHHLRSARKHLRHNDDRDKLTLERNDRFLREIRSKSDAAKVLVNLADAHREVFELCDDYLLIATRELSLARAGSPRIPAIRKGSISAAKRHRYHMLKWAELKSRSFTSDARQADAATARTSAVDALDAVERTIEVYPDESALVDSRSVLRAFLVSASVRTLLDEAEAAELAGNYEKAVRDYNNALIEFNSHVGGPADSETFTLKIRSEVERIRRMMED